jgi:pimeloyl-ACP methyl ester carboxylesterase
MTTESYLALVLMLSACSEETPPADTGIPADSAAPDAMDGGSDGAEDAAEDATGGECTRVDLDPEVVTFSTDDDVTLEADYYGAGVMGGGAAILLHMVPPGNDRNNYQRPFIQRLVDRDVAVLNVDRRGAGGSEGDAEDAYSGPNGWLDAKAAFDWLAAHGCGFDATRIVVVGASNGTTTAFDFAVETAGDSERGPAALVFLTGGTYTENQYAIADQRAVVDPLPIRFVYSTLERDWSVQFEPGAPSGWVFDEYDMGAHGTAMFMARPESMDAVADFVETYAVE